MSEETEKKEKPKATLIKHRKEEPAVAAPTPEVEDKSRKKVVVVKKKVVVVKKSPQPEETRPHIEDMPKQDKPAAAAPELPSVAASSSSAAAVAPPQATTPAETPPRRYTPPERLPPRPAPAGRPEAGQRPYLPRGPERPYAPFTPRPSGYSQPDQHRPPDRFGPPPRRDENSQRPRYGGPGAPAGPGQGSGQYGPGRYPPGPPRGPRPMGPGQRPSTGYRPTGGRPGGRPGGPPRPGSNTPNSPIGDSKQAGKKFFKTKKKEYVKKEKIQEKALQVKKKSVIRANPIPKQIDIMGVITVSELARKMNLKASELISRLIAMGMMVTINQQIDAETAAILAQEYDCQVRIVSLYDETLIATDADVEEHMRSRPPIVTIMGHVDHGKTKLLDAIRSSDVVATEFGGITQHIGAYTVQLPQGGITFLDTPGHEAFTMMRSRGAQVTDIVVLVVAANDGVMPQTIEAISHAKEAKVPIIVAVNKIDLPEANQERVKQQLSAHDLIAEDWGGKTSFVPISALKKTGIDALLETILLQAEILELKANFNCKAEGKIIESKIDQGRGIVASVLIERGTLRVGDSFIAGIHPGKVRAMFNDHGDKLMEATPSMPVEILGFTGIPNAGDPFQVTESEKFARQIGDKRQELKKMEESKNLRKITLDNLYESIKEGAIQELKVVIKGDVNGSVEALKSSLEKLSTKEIKLSVIQATAGAINERDVQLASASNAIVIGFHVRPTAKAQQVADREKVEIRKYNIIYDVVDDLKQAMEGMLAPELKEETIGSAEVRNTFKVPKIGLIAGCMVTSGTIKRGCSVHVVRDGIEIFSGKLSSLRRFKDDAREVDSGFECGIGIENFNDVKVGDVFEAFEIREIAKKLAD